MGRAVRRARLIAEWPGAPLGISARSPATVLEESLAEFRTSLLTRWRRAELAGALARARAAASGEDFRCCRSTDLLAILNLLEKHDASIGLGDGGEADLLLAAGGELAKLVLVGTIREP